MLRRITEDNEEFYLISLDLFMLISAMGVTIGLMFIVLKMEFWSIKSGAITPISSNYKTVTKEDFNKLLNDVETSIFDRDSLFFKIKMNKKISITANDCIRIHEKKRSSGEGFFIQVDISEANKVLNDSSKIIPFLLILYKEKKDSVSLELVFYRSNGSFTEKKDIAEVNNEVDKWDLLKKAFQKF